MLWLSRVEFMMPSLFIPWRTCARGLLQLSCVSVCVCLSAGANLQTGASKCLTEGTSGLSSTFFTNIERRFL